MNPQVRDGMVINHGTMDDGNNNNNSNNDNATTPNNNDNNYRGAIFIHQRYLCSKPLLVPFGNKNANIQKCQGTFRLVLRT